MLMHVNIKVLSLKVSGNVWRHNADEQMLLKEKKNHIEQNTSSVSLSSLGNI